MISVCPKKGDGSQAVPGVFFNRHIVKNNPGTVYGFREVFQAALLFRSSIAIFTSASAATCLLCVTMITHFPAL